MIWLRKSRRVPVDLINAWETAAIKAAENEQRARPKTIDEYLSLTPNEQNGAILTSALMTELCESVAALRALQEKP